MDINTTFEDYYKIAPDKREINYWDLPEGLCVNVDLNKLPRKLKTHKGFRGKTNTITLGRLKRNFGNNKKVNKSINYFLNWRNRREQIYIKMPLKLKNKHYAQIYSLMLSEGSHKTGFNIHVPEKEFHFLFKESLNNLININKFHSNKFKGIDISSVTRRARYFIPIPEHIPKFILENKDFARIYLKIAFEAEANFRYKILKDGAVNRRIKLSRNYGVDKLININLPYKIGKRIYWGTLKKDFPKLSKLIENHCSPTILGERLLLKKHFDIDTSLYPEYLRINKTCYRKGKISVKWTLTIHSININKFISLIGNMTERKKKIAKDMLKTKVQRPKYTIYKLIKEIAQNNVFRRRDLDKKMKILGYKATASVFIRRYKNKGLIKRLNRGIYIII